LPEGEEPLPFARITLRPKDGLKLGVTLLRHCSFIAYPPAWRPHS
jgi:hypothetical protein